MGAIKDRICALRNSWIGYPGNFLDVRKCSQEFPWVLQSKAKVKRTPCGPSGGKLGVATSALESAAKAAKAPSCKQERKEEPRRPRIQHPRRRRRSAVRICRSCWVPSTRKRAQTPETLSAAMPARMLEVSFPRARARVTMEPRRPQDKMKGSQMPRRGRHPQQIFHSQVTSRRAGAQMQSFRWATNSTRRSCGSS